MPALQDMVLPMFGSMLFSQEKAEPLITAPLFYGATSDPANALHYGAGAGTELWYGSEDGN